MAATRRLRFGIVPRVSQIRGSVTRADGRLIGSTGSAGCRTCPFIEELTADYAARWYALEAGRPRTKPRIAKSGPSGLRRQAVQAQRGNALVDVVRRTLRNNELTYTKAAKVLGVKPSSVEPLLRRLEHSRGALIPDLRR